MSVSILKVRLYSRQEIIPRLPITFKSPCFNLCKFSISLINRSSIEVSCISSPSYIVLLSLKSFLFSSKNFLIIS
nr:MAG TPA: hypothetical protein [Bacteriophage sp.]